MQCEKFEQRLHAVLDERSYPEDDAELRLHAEACPACREVWIAQRLLWEGLAQCEAVVPTEGFAEAVVQAAVAGSADWEKMNAVGQGARVGGRPRLAPNARTLTRKNSLHWIVGGVAVAGLLALAPAAYRLFLAPEAHVPLTPTVARQPLPTVEQHIAAPPLPPRNDVALTSALERQPVVPPAPRAVAQTPSAPSPVLNPVGATAEERYALMLERLRMQLPELGDQLGLTDRNAPTVQGAAAVSQLTNRLRTPLAASLESTLNVLRTAVLFSEQDPTKPQANLPVSLSHAAMA